MLITIFVLLRILATICAQDTRQRQVKQFRLGSAVRREGMCDTRVTRPYEHNKGLPLRANGQAVLHLHGVRRLWLGLPEATSLEPEPPGEKRQAGRLGAGCAAGHLVHALEGRDPYGHQD